MTRCPWRWNSRRLGAFLFAPLIATALAIAVCAASETAQAGTAKTDPTVSIMQGFGYAYSMSVTRGGIYDWEFGLLNAGTNMLSYGVMKIFRMDGLYSGIGPTVSAHLLGAASPGVFGALGYEYVIALGVFVRAEINTEVAFNGTTQASSALMIGWGLW
jgi:hypothetical protein